MKTILTFKLIALLSFIPGIVYSQSIQGLVFTSPQLLSGTDLQKGAVYLFRGVKSGINATVIIDTLVGGAQVRKIDDNSGGLGYLNSFQPEIRIPSGTGTPYVQMTISFIDSITGVPQVMNNVEATAVDIDGNQTLKEMVEINMGGGLVSFMNSALDISVVQLLLSKFNGTNILGIERSGIDTSALGNMFSVAKTNLSSFSVRFGATTLLSNNSNRQYSMYMKGFQYPVSSTLPVKLELFTAVLNKEQNKVDLKWTTSAEINVSHFIIEKSYDGKNFNDAGLVFAYGNSTEKANYIFSDNIANTLQSVIYYRLRSVDNDSKSQVSETRIIRIAKNKAQLTMVTYPNPVSNELRITIPSGWQGKPVLIEVFNQNGQRMNSIKITTASQTETILVNNLAKGFYVLNATCEAEAAREKFIKN